MISGFTQTHLEYTIIESYALTPVFERETFSGGWNDSAIERNRKRLDRARIVVDHHARIVYCAKGVAAILATKIRGAEVTHLGQRKDTP